MMITKSSGKFRLITLTVLLVGGVFLSSLAYRGIRLLRFAKGTHTQYRYLIENGGTIGEAPASQTFSVDYLEAIFGENPELLDKLKSVVQTGLSDLPALNLGEVAAMIVTYRRNGNDQVEDVVAHVIGGFPLGKLKPGFHRDGYFKYLVDPSLWNAGNSAIGFLGRDLVLFAEEQVAQSQQELIESVLSGDIMPLVNGLDRPIHFTAVLPDPRGIVPRQLRNHIQAVVVKGFMGMYDGQVEAILLTPSPKSATYALSLVGDLKKVGEYTLKTQFKGVVRQEEWGEVIDPWWAYEMVQVFGRAVIEKDANIVRMNVDFGRVMVNVILKSMERMGRDLAQIKGTLEERLDPRLVDAQHKSMKPSHYWNDPHRWGPNWPIMPTTNKLENAKTPAPSEASIVPEDATSS